MGTEIVFLFWAVKDSRGKKVFQYYKMMVKEAGVSGMKIQERVFKAKKIRLTLDRIN